MRVLSLILESRPAEALAPQGCTQTVLSKCMALWKWGSLIRLSLAVWLGLLSV